MNVVLMGMPGVGKGTQAAMLKDALNVPHVSSGDILREAVRAGSSLGRKVRGLLESGQLVPDDMMGDLIVNRLGQNDARGGFVLDGFPRTQPQVGILDRALNRLGGQLDAVFLLTAPEDEIVRRSEAVAKGTAKTVSADTMRARVLDRIRSARDQ